MQQIAFFVTCSKSHAFIPLFYYWYKDLAPVNTLYASISNASDDKPWPSPWKKQRTIYEKKQ